MAAACMGVPADAVCWKQGKGRRVSARRLCVHVAAGGGLPCYYPSQPHITYPRRQKSAVCCMRRAGGALAVLTTRYAQLL